MLPFHAIALHPNTVPNFEIRPCRSSAQVYKKVIIYTEKDVEMSTDRGIFLKNCQDTQNSLIHITYNIDKELASN
uniref:Uncharacterized protein n=1 Tax=Romanomermis culicivorax TaxID=13658 RepID=A0A915L0E1_ROMCU